MKVYHVQYIGSDDLTHHSYHTSKKAAKEMVNRLNEDVGVKLMFDIYDFKFPLTRVGVMEMLNRQFNETQ